MVCPACESVLIRSIEGICIKCSNELTNLKFRSRDTITREQFIKEKQLQRILENSNE